MAKFCIQCGATLNDGARFCGECGAIVPASGTDTDVQAVPVAQPSAPEIAEPAYASNAAPSAVPSHADRDYRDSGDKHAMPDAGGGNWMLIAGGVVLVLLLVGYYLIFLRDDAAPPLAERVKTEPRQVEEVAAKTFFAVAEANIRDRATAKGTSIIGKVARAGTVSGRVIIGEDETTSWLELADGKGFVAMVNLSETAPPQLVKMLGDKSWTVDKPIDVRSQPNPSSGLVDRLSAGTTINLFGLTANDFIEIKLKKGGVGYIPDGARIAALADSKPIAIAFNPASCSFGPEIDRMFASLTARVSAQYKALENRDYPSEEAREKALGAMENRSTFETLQRNYQGLTVTGIAQHYESQSIYFADAPAKVVEVFRGQGFKIGRDGQFSGTELYAGIGGTQAQGARYGRSDLSCGV